MTMPDLGTERLSLNPVAAPDAPELHIVVEPDATVGGLDTLFYELRT
jgi:hypothetical protein